MLVMAAGGLAVGYIEQSRARAVSDQSLREQMSVVNELFTRVSEDTLLNQPGMSRIVIGDQNLHH